MSHNAHKLKFQKGIPVLSEITRNVLLEKGFDEGQIKNAIESMSRELLKKAIEAQNHRGKECHVIVLKQSEWK